MAIRRFLRVMLTSAGCGVHETADGASGLLKAAQLRGIVDALID